MTSHRPITVVVALALALSAQPVVAQQPAGRAPVKLTVLSDGHPLALWQRAPATPTGVIVLLHGRTWSALPDFDLQVPGEHRSVMQALVQRGYAVYALDARGYGASPRDSTGWLTPSRAAADVANVLRFVARRHPHLPAPTLLGWSYGSLVAHLEAQRNPALQSGVVLFGYPRDVDVPVAASPDSVTPRRETNTATNAASDFIIPGAITPKAVQAYVAAALKADPVRADWRALQEWNELSAPALTVPTLVLHGERDPYAPIGAQSHLFTKLGSPDRRWVILAGGDHAALLEQTLPAFIDAIIDFIERPRLR